MCDLHSKFEEDRTKTVVAIVKDTYFGQTDTHRHTVKWFYICPMPCIALDRQKGTSHEKTISRQTDSAGRWDEETDILTVVGSHEIHCQPVPSLGLCQQHALFHPLKRSITHKHVLTQSWSFSKQIPIVSCLWSVVYSTCQNLQRLHQYLCYIAISNTQSGPKWHNYFGRLNFTKY